MERIIAIDKIPNPHTLHYQLDLLAKVGFSGIDVLHKNWAFAAFGGDKIRTFDGKKPL